MRVRSQKSHRVFSEFYDPFSFNLDDDDDDDDPPQEIDFEALQKEPWCSTYQGLQFDQLMSHASHGIIAHAEALNVRSSHASLLSIILSFFSMSRTRGCDQCRFHPQAQACIIYNFSFINDISVPQFSLD